jgi:hypothetical protein
LEHNKNGSKIASLSRLGTFGVKSLLALAEQSFCINPVRARYRAMGSAITSVTQMVSVAGDLRRDAKQVTEPELAAKFHRAAAELETKALARVGQAGPMIGKLLDTFA